MKTFKKAQSLYNLEYLSSPTLTEDSQTLYYIQTRIDDSSDSYSSAIIEHNLINHNESVLVDDGFINKSPCIIEDKLFFLSNTSGTFQIYAYDLNSQTSKQLTFSDHSIQSLEANPIKTCLVYTSQIRQDQDDTKERFQTIASSAPYYRFNNLKYQSDGTGFIDSSLVNSLYEFNLTTGESKVLAPQSTGYGIRRTVSVSEDGENYIYEGLLILNDDYNSDTGLYSYNRQSEKITHLTKKFPVGIFGEGSLSPDSSYIAIIGNALSYETSNQFDLYLYDCKRVEMHNLSTEIDIQFADNSVSDIYQNISRPLIQWHPKGDKFYVTSSEYAGVYLYEVTLNGYFRRISPDKKVVKEFVVGKDGSLLAVMSSYDKPVALFKYDGKDWEEIPMQISHHYSSYQTGDYLEIQTQAADGGIIHGVMNLPVNFDPDRKYPLILTIHGGPYTMHAWNFYHESQYLAANDYIVLLLYPRGSYGYDQKHTKGVYQRYGKEDYTDLMTAVDYVLNQHSYVDPDRLFVTGGSYGGYMTNWIVTQIQRFKAAVTQRSMSNFVSMFGTSDIGYFFYRDELALDISHANQLWEMSPLAYAENVETPLLIIHAKDDLRCQFDQAQQFYVALKHFKKEAELLVFPNSSHELSRTGRPSYRVARLEAMLEWFERYDVSPK